MSTSDVPGRQTDVRKPSVDASAAAVPRPFRSGPEAETAAYGSPERPRVLVFEDDFLVSSEIEAALTEAGFNVVGVAASAEDGIALASALHPAVAVMDIRLAGPRDGIDAALELFRTRGLRCVFATAHMDAEARRRAAPAQPLGWLQKPYAMASLVHAVEAAVAQLKQNR
ncbi:MAG TPA: response regulator [Candidatus Cybelea sp.]|nr:response regulator [Candidatus Cybelea sp.]